MPLIAIWVGVILFGLGAIFSLLAAVRTLQASRRWSDYRLRRRYVVQARGSVLFSLFSAAIAVALLIFGRSIPESRPSAPAPTATGIFSATAPSTPVIPPTGTAVPATE